MLIIDYDKTFDGFLCAAGEIIKNRLTAFRFFQSADHSQNIFDDRIYITTDTDLSAKVWSYFKTKLSSQGSRTLYCSYLLEGDGQENYLMGFIQHVLKNGAVAEKDYSNTHVIKTLDGAKKVHREKHRMEAFVRFQLTHDGIFYSTVEPDFNVLPLIVPHFTRRYADQKWLIIDVKRKYGIYYDLEKTEMVIPELNPEALTANKPGALTVESELLYQQLWKTYFSHVNIPLRKNTKLHLKHVPKRYWNYLTEKSLT